MYKPYFIEMTDGDALDMARAEAQIEAIREICKRAPAKRAAMRSIVNAQLNVIATINARYV